MSTRIRKPSARRLEAEAADPTIFAKPSRIPVPQRDSEATSEEAPPKKRSRVTMEDEDHDTEILGDVPPLNEVSDSEDEGDDEDQANPIDVNLVEKRK
jgi:hypothetical protein